MKLTVGSFMLDEGDQIIAPADYMQARGLELLERLAKGADDEFEDLLTIYETDEATLRRLDADYNDWMAERQ